MYSLLLLVQCQVSHISMTFCSTLSKFFPCLSLALSVFFLLALSFHLSVYFALVLRPSLFFSHLCIQIHYRFLSLSHTHTHTHTHTHGHLTHTHTQTQSMSYSAFLQYNIIYLNIKCLFTLYTIKIA